MASIFAGLTPEQIKALTPQEIGDLVDKSMVGRVWISRSSITWSGTLRRVGEARAVPEAEVEQFLADGWHLVTPESGD
ncbi:MAG: hypothetical protein ABSG46_20605 [Candidatus Binataceae bacterium]|jgi:hypothetical protein